MLSDLCLHFPEVRSCFDLADQLFTPRKGSFLLPSQIIYPHPDPSGPGRSQLQQRLWQEDGVLAAIYAADGAFYSLLNRLGVRPDMMVGHSFGDFFPLLFASSPDVPRFMEAMVALEQLVRSVLDIYEQRRSQGTVPENLTLLNVGADADTVSNLFDEIHGPLYISMDNCPHQVVVVGETGAVAQLIALLKRRGIFYEELPLDQPAYHTPLFEGARKPLEDFRSQWTPPAHIVEVYSCTTASPYPKDPAGMRQLYVEHWMRRVEFRKTIEAMYGAGARIFVEVGPGGILTAFIDDILRGRPYLAVACNVPRRSGIVQLNHLVGMLASQRVPIDLEFLYRRRAPQRLSLDAAVDNPTNGRDSPIVVDLAQLGTPVMKLSRPLLAARGVHPNATSGPYHPATTQPPLQSNRVLETDNGLPSTKAQGPGEVVQAPASSPRTTHENTPPIHEPDRYAAGNPPSPGVLGNAMQTYLQTMDLFLETQEQVMHSLMAKTRAAAPPTQQSMQPAGRAKQWIQRCSLCPL